MHPAAEINTTSTQEQYASQTLLPNGAFQLLLLPTIPAPMTDQFTRLVPSNWGRSNWLCAAETQGKAWLALC